MSDYTLDNLELKNYRIINKLTQLEVAEHLHMSQTNYTDIENGVVMINVKHLLKLSKLYKCTPNDLLGIREIYMREMGKLDD